MDEITLYLGTLAAIGIGGLILIVIILTRGSGGNKGQKRLRAEYREATVPRVQVILGEPEAGLIWVVNGRATRDLATISDPTERRAIEVLVEQVKAVEVETMLSSAALTYPELASPIGELKEPLPTPETPLMPPPPPSAISDEDELARPFLSRLRDSLFGVDYETKPSQRTYAPRPIAPPPAKGKKGKEGVEELDFGLPRFEELNTLLQQRLAAVADAPHATIRRGRDGMLEILVQGRVYDHIDDVPDEVVRQAMREAVAIWNGS